MFPPEVACVLLPLIVATSLVLMLVRPRGIAEVYWIGGGVLLLVLLRLIPLSLAGRAVAGGTDVYLFLLGMMILAELAREHGVFGWVAAFAVRGARGSAARLFTLVYAVGTLVTICMSNDATAVVLTPAILAAIRTARARPLPHLFACALVANAASFVLPISNPANLVVFSSGRGGMPTLGQWLLLFGVPSLLSIAATYVVLRVYFRAELRGQVEEAPVETRLSSSGRLVAAGIAALVVTLLFASARKTDLGPPACLVALFLTALVSLRTRTNPLKLARRISWATLLLVAGLFVMVAAVESQGALRATRALLERAQQLPQSVAVLVLGGAVGVANNLLNNLPLGLLAGATLQAAQPDALIKSAVLIGVDLGPNLSITGSLATILWLLALRKERLEVSLGSFLKVGVIAMPVALLAALGGALLMHAVVRGPAP